VDPQRETSGDDERTGYVGLSRGGAGGFDAVLAWKPLAPLLHGLPISDSMYGRERELSFSGTDFLDLPTLLRLTAKYLTGVHVKNPILDPVILQHYILEVAQHGLDWSSQACLVCLVCAIGAILGSDATSASATPSQTTTVSLISEPELASEIFTEASKRLGIAISQDDVLAIQCACLAG